jgi:hypothetical protein
MSKKFATKTGRVAAGGSLLVGGVAGALVLAPRAGAVTTFHVTTTSDSGAGSLRQAVLDANANPGADIIVFDASSAGTITLTTGEIAIFDDVTITGLSAADSIISGNNNSRIFYMYDGGAMLTISISALTMTDGFSRQNGGAIYSIGNDLTLSSVVITGNAASRAGGAVYSGDAKSRNAPTTIINSEISNNTAATDGGGIDAYSVGDITITNTVITGNNCIYGGGGGAHIKYTSDVTIDSSTIDQNSAFNDGGGLYAVYTDSFTMTNSTVSGNNAIDGAGLLLAENGDVLIANSTIANNIGDSLKSRGGALYSWGSNGDTRILFSTISGNSTKSNTVFFTAYSPYIVEIIGTIISDNTTSEGSGAQAVDFNLFGSASVTFTNSLIMGSAVCALFTDGGGNVHGVSAQLGALADNGGATFTMEPEAGSPVIDAGPVSWTAFTGDGFDQRGTPHVRESNGQSDMGAFEVQSAPTPPSTTVVPGDTSTTVGTDPVAPAFTG